MVGTIGFYDRDGERQHTIYLAATPEYGKATFLDRLERESGGRAAYQASYVGLADGAKGNWEFLGRHTAVQVIDFWHAAEYLSDAADALFAREPGAKRPWLESSCHRLKHEPGAARQLIRDLKRLAAEKGVAPDHPEVEAAITYFTNQSKAGRMDYAPLVESNPDRLGGDGGGVQGPGQAAAVRVGDEVEGAGCGGGVERAMPDVHDRALVAVLGQDRPGWVPGCGLMLHASEVTPLFRTQVQFRAKLGRGLPPEVG